MTFVKIQTNVTTEKIVPEFFEIPGLTSCERARSLNGMSYSTEQNYGDYEERFEQRITASNFDVDGGEAEGWLDQMRSELDGSATYWNSDHPEYGNPYVTSAEIEQRAIRSSASEVRDYCRVFDGYKASEAEAIQIYDDHYIYMDWMNCVRIWRSQLPKEMEERIDWSQVNPNRYRISSNGSVNLIS